MRSNPHLYFYHIMEFVNYELAKRLKEKGFTLPKSNVVGKFDSDGVFHSQLYINFTETMDSEEIIAPTISQVLKWLREEKEIDLVIEPLFYENRHREYGIRVFAPRLNKPVHCGYFNKWEQAALAGINYYLDNLD